MNLNTFGERLLYARKHLNSYGQETVAKACDTTRMTISGWEKRTIAKVEASTLSKVCHFLGVNLEWMVDGTGPVRIRDKAAPSTSLRSLPVIDWNSIPVHKSGSKTLTVSDVEVPAYISGGPRSCITQVPQDYLVEFNKGDTLICDPDGSPDNGQYLLYNLDGKMTIVSYIELPGGRMHVSPLTQQAQLSQYDENQVAAIVKGKWYR